MILLILDVTGHNRHIDATIYSTAIRTTYTKDKHVGIDDTHNGYAEELTAIHMVITLFEEKIDEYRNVYIFADNRDPRS